jgi:phage terminase large subunit-like protein
VTSSGAAAAQRLVTSMGRASAHLVADIIWDSIPALDAAALTFAWEEEWARPKQLPPPGDLWQSWGLLAGRGFGKTIAVSKYVNAEAESGRAMLICLAAQDEDNSVKLQVTGPSGLIATAPPWCKPEWEASKLELVWPNGARAYVRTPEVPGKIRGLEYHLSWICELQSWPAATRDEAFMNVLLSTRLGYARIAWDATPRRRHPLLRKLLANAETDPTRHIVARGTTFENPHLSGAYKKKLDEEIGGTQRGREELLGEFLDDSDAALVRQAWIDEHRRHSPEILTRRVIGIDPAVTNRAGNDKTGIIDAGLGVDGQVYVCGDYSGKHAPGAWAAIVLEKYVRNACDCVVVETNKGGDLVTQNLRAEAPKRGLTVVVIGKDEKPRRTAGTVYVRETHARGSKEDRAQPLATAYERGRVSHVIGADLRELEDTITTWEPTPGQRSPDALDALVHATTELLGLLTNKGDPAVGFKGIQALAAAVAKPSRGPAKSIAQILGGDTGGRI